MKQEIKRAVDAYNYVRERRTQALTAANMVDNVAKLNEQKADDDQIKDAIHAVDAVPIVGAYIRFIRKAPNLPPIPVRAVHDVCVGIARQSRKRNAVVAAAKAFMSATEHPRYKMSGLPLYERTDNAYINSVRNGTPQLARNG
jgi:hypothetical protein